MEKKVKLEKGALVEAAARVRDVQDFYRQGLFAAREAPEGISSGRRAAEVASLKNIFLGEPDRLAALYEQEEAEEIAVGDLSDSSVKEALYLAISAITLYTRAAIDGGLPENIAYTMSDSYIRKADACGDSRQIIGLMQSASVDFASAVREWGLGNAGPVTRAVRAYVDSHLHEKIAMADLEKATGRAKNYISDVFAAETGMRPSVYIRLHRLYQAAYELKYTEKPVAEIAATLAFPSHSAFCTAFKKAFGCTPLNFRRRQDMV